MSELTLSINQKPSLLSALERQTEKINWMEVNKAISGSWAGYQEYIIWKAGDKDDFAISIFKHSYPKS